jgi:CheY-like chemotaxis protein
MKKHIMLIDDDEEELTLFVDAMNQLHISYKCTWAISGEQAIQQLLYLTPDIIFLDLQMPGMNGLTCLAAIREMPRLKNTPIIIHSSALTDECRQKAKTLGASACLVKSGDASALEAILSEYIPAESMMER